MSIHPTDTLRFSAPGTNHIDRTRQVKNVTITNSGTGAATVTNFSLTRSNTTKFTVQNTTDPTLAPGEATTRNITFTSSTNGTYSATLVIEHTGLESPENLSLVGSRGAVQPTDPTARALAITGRDSVTNITQNDVTIAVTRFGRGLPVNGVEITQSDITTIITLFERN